MFWSIRKACCCTASSPPPTFRIPDVNFHGLTLPVRLPQIDTVEGGIWSARADIDSCPDLELVLPARKEAVETPFLEEMREAARLAVYRAMAQADPAPRVAWTDWHKAKEATIEMPEPPAELRPWRPAIYDALFPGLSVVPKGSCSDVQRAVSGLRSARDLHHVEALGLIDKDDRSASEIEHLAKNGIFALDVRSVEALYYCSDAIAAVAGRQAESLGSNDDELIELAKTKALDVLKQSGLAERMAARRCERTALSR